ncbi:unnamed protein product [Phytophthora fragariaefolia]|uniref:Unnamed protein product n=1 Tax=Phytophthora fragariaefolia TaxID=1490495 RepID=A0A9W6XH77_9STRA|nr:unnamed protein product [Phytophthora fragariaefolia]
MARTKQTAAHSTGGRTPRHFLARGAAWKTSSGAAATTTRWQVWTISDRLGTQISRDSRYYVEYIVSVGKAEGSWQPRWLLEEDGFTEYLELVDAYKAAAGPMTFGEYALSRPDDFSQAMGASEDSRCAFHALAHAVDALGIPAWCSDDIVNHFYRAHAAVGNAIASEGVVWSTLWSFIRQVNRSARGAGRPQICKYTIRVNQIQSRLSGVETCLGLEHLLLAPGVYLCAGILAGPQRKSHAFMLQVTTAGRFASDDSVAQVPLLEYAYSWLARLRFVRRVLIR